MESEGPDYRQGYMEMSFKRENTKNHLMGGRLLECNNTAVVESLLRPFLAYDIRSNGPLQHLGLSVCTWVCHWGGCGRKSPEKQCGDIHLNTPSSHNPLAPHPVNVNCTTQK